MMIRDFDGWEQIYLHNSDGSLRQKLTSGRKWNTKIVKINENTIDKKFNVDLIEAIMYS